MDNSLLLKKRKIRAKQKTKKFFHSNVNDYICLFLRKVLLLVLIFSFILPPHTVHAQSTAATVLNLPVPGVMVPVTSVFAPATIRGINIYPDDPLKFDFIIDQGDDDIAPDEFKAVSEKLIKYFLASLTVPENEMWVNLSPYEKDRVIPSGFGRTEMGRDLLAQDYLLKQLTASLMYPENELGREFWDRVYKKAYERFGTTEIPMNTFNKIWIVPEAAKIYEHDKGALIVDSYLKVMLEEDYLARENNLSNEGHDSAIRTTDDIEIISGVSSEVIREVLIPEIEREVNEGKTFANLRQIYHSMILASWYKDVLQGGALGKIYIDQNKTKGVDVKDKEINQKIYDQYLTAFKKGVFEFIKEDYDSIIQETIPRKYFSGGIILPGTRETVQKIDIAMNKMRVVTATMEGILSQQASSSPISKKEIVERNILELMEKMKFFRGGGKLPVSRMLEERQEEINAMLKGETIMPSPSLLYIEIQPTDHCQFNCKFCRGGLRNLPKKSSWIKGKDLTRFLRSVPDEIHSDNIYVRYSGSIGDPLLHPSIVDFLKVVNDRGWHLGLVTNGLLLDDRLYEELIQVDFVNISVDAGTEATYYSLKGGRQGDLNRVIQNVGNFVSFRNEHNAQARVVISFLLQEDNKDEIEEIASLAQKAGADALEFKVQHYNEKRTMKPQDIQSAHQEIKRVGALYENEAFQISILQDFEESLDKIRKPQKIDFPICFVSRLGLSMAIDPKGNIQSCCQYHANTLGPQGHIEQSFMDFWNGKKRSEALARDPRTFCKGNSCAPSHFIENNVMNALREGSQSGLDIDKLLEPEKTDKKKGNASSPIETGVKNDLMHKDNKGGIDFNPSILNLEIQKGQGGVVMPFNQRSILHGNIGGFSPVIISITSVADLSLFLGLYGELFD